MNIDSIKRLKKYVENGTHTSGKLGKLADRYSQQNVAAISALDIIINSNRANTIIKDGIAYKCIVDYGRLPAKSNLSNLQLNYFREIWTKREDNIKAGDIVEFAHSSDRNLDTYILMKAVETRESFDLSIMQKANGTLKWLDPDGAIKETPFTLKFTPAINPLESDQIMLLSKERRTILVQANEDTKEIKKDKRFIFDDRCWKVIGYNGLTDGLLEISLEEDQIDTSVDNLTERIADYYGNVANYSVVILNGDRGCIALDDSLQLNVRVFNNSQEVSSPLLHFSSSNDEVAKVNTTGLITSFGIGEVEITVGYKESYATFRLNVTDRRVYNYTLEIVGSDEIKYGQTQKYKVEFYNNGTPISDNALFSLTAIDGTPTTLAYIKTFDSNSCFIEAGKTIGKVLLTVSNGNRMIYGTKEIKIKSLI